MQAMPMLSRSAEVAAAPGMYVDADAAARVARSAAALDSGQPGPDSGRGLELEDARGQPGAAFAARKASAYSGAALDAVDAETGVGASASAAWTEAG